MTDILMPKLSDTMTEGVLGSWKKNVGEKITRGDVVAEVETDKAVMELEAFTSGRLLEQRVKSGTTVQVGTVIGVIGENGETAEQPQRTEQFKEDVKKDQPEQMKSTEPDSSPAEKPPDEFQEDKSVRTTVKSAPIVRRKAHELGVEIDDVKGSGPDGRVLIEDVERYAADTKKKQEIKAPEKQRAEADTSKPIQTTAVAEKTALNKMRKAIASTVSKSWSTIPHFAVSIQIRADKMLELKHELKKNALSVSLNDFMIKASAICLERFPLVNASLSEEEIQIHRNINIGMMVSVTEGLLVPVIKNCENLTLGQIAENSSDLAERARNGKITEQDLTQGTFSISNLGMFGVSRFFAVILPGQAAILAVGGIMDTFVTGDGKTEASKTIEVTLSADHRILDGAYAAGFLGELKQVLENPVRLLIV